MLSAQKHPETSSDIKQENIRRPQTEKCQNRVLECIVCLSYVFCFHSYTSCLHSRTHALHELECVCVCLHVYVLLPEFILSSAIRFATSVYVQTAFGTRTKQTVLRSDGKSIVLKIKEEKKKSIKVSEIKVENSTQSTGDFAINESLRINIFASI